MTPIVCALLLAPPNLARGCAYTVDPQPNYQHCTEPGDAVQLTDGEYVEGYFWVQPGCVGWQATGHVLVTIDLGEPRSIGGVSFSTAAGTAGVTWPSAIYLLVSDDGEAWYEAGEITGLADPPPAEGYATHRYVAGGLAARGRYLAVGVLPSGPYTFCDEIEVYQGDAPDAALAGEPITDPAAWLLGKRYDAEVRWQVATSIEAVGAAAEAAALDEERRRQVLALLPAVAGLPVEAPKLERATLPLTPQQLAAFHAQATLWRAMGRPELTAWTANRWDPLVLTDPPPAEPEPPLLEVELMQGEVRAAALNLANAGGTSLLCEASLDGLPGATLHEVVWTAVQGRPPAAAALPELDGPLRLVAGLTGQLWLSIDSRGLAPGRYDGTLRLAGDGVELAVPVVVRVSAVAMPAERALSLGGWDYTDGPGRGITDDNLDDTVDFLRRYGIDSPWATSRVMPFGRHDATGAMVEPPDTAAMDAWLDRWPGARWYCVFNSFGTPLGDEAGRRRVSDWIEFWVGHLEQRGIDAGQLCLLLADEPRDEESAALVVTYAEVIGEAAPEVVIWNDPIFTAPREAPAALLETSTVLCPNRVQWLANPAEFDAVYSAQREAGRRLALYSCSGPIRALDPYAYLLRQAWEAFRIGAEQSFFWAFCDSGAGDAWLELGTGRTCFSPQFLGPDGNVTSKQMEAIRESQQDYQYLVMLREALAAGRGDAAWRRAAADLLETGPRRVLGEPDPRSIEWHEPKDRGTAERVRLEVLRLLEEVMAGG